jgi:hypothetical protein
VHVVSVVTGLDGAETVTTETSGEPVHIVVSDGDSEPGVMVEISDGTEPDIEGDWLL